MVGRPVDAARSNLRLEDRRNRLWFAGQPALDPIELRCVHRRQLDHAKVNVDLVMDQFRADGIGEAADSVFCAAISGLEGNTPIGESGAHLHDRSAISWNHELQSRHRSINNAEVSYFSYALEFLRIHFVEAGKHRDHGIVDPDVDRPKTGLDGDRRSLDL